MRNNIEKNFEKNLWSNSGERAGKLVSKAAQKKLRKLFLPLAAGLMLLFSALLLSSCGPKEAESTESPEGESQGKTDNVVNVYNWGEYIDPEVITEFQQETGIKVVYDMFETNEEMYPVIEAGGVLYDAVCPSDYMIEKMMQNHLWRKSTLRTFPISRKSEKNIWKCVRSSIRGIVTWCPIPREP